MPQTLVGITFRIDRETLRNVDSLIAGQNSHRPPDYGFPPAPHCSRSLLLRYLVNSGLETLAKRSTNQT